MENIFICIPTYNEADNIIALLEKLNIIKKFIKNYQIKVVIVDDNSPDGTGDIIEKYKIDHPNYCLFTIHNSHKTGLGKAYIQAFSYALSQKAFAVLMMDADFSHNPEYIPSILNQLNKYDFIIGSRYTKGGGVVNWPLKRKLISRLGNFYAQIILSSPINDLTGGFNCYKAEVIKKLHLDTLKSEGYSFQIELKYRAYKIGYKYHEVPIIFKDREFGKSKFSSGIFREAIITPWKLRFGLF